LATGKPITYTVTGPNGAIITETGIAVPGNGTSRGVNVGAAAAGSVAGVLFIVALYLAFCAFLYRKQLAIYKRHVAIASANEDGAYAPQGQPRNAGGRFGWLAGLRKESTEGSSGIYSSGGRHSGRHSGGHSAARSSPNRLSDDGGGVGYAPGQTASTPVAGRYAYAHAGQGSPQGSQEDLMTGMEPSYWGVLLHPRRSLRVINR
jgi:hypothetical protein